MEVEVNVGKTKTGLTGILLRQRKSHLEHCRFKSGNALAHRTVEKYKLFSI